MKNVTITMDEEVAEWIRVEAARRGTSMSRLIGELVKDKMEIETGYDAAARAFFDRAPSKLKDEGATYPSRDDIHER